MSEGYRIEVQLYGATEADMDELEGHLEIACSASAPDQIAWMVSDIREAVAQAEPIE